MIRYFLLGLGLAMVPAAAVAEDAAPPRYQLKELAGGVVRLDTATGDIAFCQSKDDALQCSGVSTPSQTKIKALEGRISALEKQVSELKAEDGKMPSDAEVDRGLSIMEKFMRRFMGIAKEFGLENGKDDPNNCDPLPQRGGTCL
jgi:hypothetical protein